VTLTSVFDPVTGDAVVAGASTTYTPPPGFAGRDTYQYTVCDDGVPVLCSTGLVTVVVDPVATDDAATTPAGTPVTIDVAANDFGTVLAPGVATPPANGTVDLVDGRLVYTPAPGFVGTDTFTYLICAADVSPACDTAVVTVVVTAPAGPDVPGVPGDPRAPGGTGGSGDPGASAGGRLPTTGADNGPLGALALALVGTGAALLTRVRRVRAGG
jgi:LPXTG-motif cell wall-anchored protein